MSIHLKPLLIDLSDGSYYHSNPKREHVLEQQ